MGIKITIIILTFIILSPIASNAQYAQYQFDKDSLDYPYFLPFLGKKTVEAGFDIPHPVGIGVNNFWAQQSIIIENLAIGFTTNNVDIPLTDISDVIEFEDVYSEVYSITVRPDIWIFPFLNVYGIFGKTFSTTTTSISSPIEVESIVELAGNTYGVGITGAFGIDKYFLALDGNWAWTTMEAASKPVQSSVFSQRLGRSFQLGNKPEQSIVFWLGAMRVKFKSETDGSLRLDEVLSDDVWERKDEIVDDYWAWYDELGPLDPKKKIADEVLTPIVEKIDAGDGSGEVHYRLDKRPKGEWNMLVGGQYQLNKHWQVRAEGGFIGDRSSFLLSANYRFGIKGGNKLRK